VGITLDRPLFVERGELASHEGDAPLLSNSFRASLFWLGHAPLALGSQYRLRLGMAEAAVTVERIERVIDTDTLAPVDASAVQRDQAAVLWLRSAALLALDDHGKLPATGRFMLREKGVTVAGGLVLLR